MDANSSCKKKVKKTYNDSKKPSNNLYKNRSPRNIKDEAMKLNNNNSKAKKVH